MNQLKLYTGPIKHQFVRIVWYILQMGEGEITIIEFKP